MRVLLVEDEPDLGAAIKRTLNQEAYVVDWVLNGTEAWGYLEKQWTQYTLAILDWLLPGVSGLELCQRLRAQGNPLPVLMLTAKDRFDDYLVAVRLILLLGLPAAMLSIGGASWWLAGRAMQPVHQSYQQMQQFSADVAHELRTPLAAIQATVESALRLTHLPELEARDILSRVERQNHRLSQLVKDLLLLSRMDQQALPVKRQTKSCLNDLISDVEEEFAALAIAAEVTLTTEIRVPKPLYVTGDEEQLYRLVSNLVVNAIQYTPAGGQVTVVLDCNNHHALIQVHDTGVGIAPEEQTRIFDRFYRVNSDRSRHTGGSGLGLPIAAAIAQAHHGSIHVQSELGFGSTFTISFAYAIGC